jgi:hypothetical protein
MYVQVHHARLLTTDARLDEEHGHLFKSHFSHAHCTLSGPRPVLKLFEMSGQMGLTLTCQVKCRVLESQNLTRHLLKMVQHI